MYCSCYRVLSVEEARLQLEEEIDELAYAEKVGVSEHLVDERSDVVFAVNRLLGAMQGVEYVKSMKGDEIHIEKINRRMAEYGCIRSKTKAIKHT